MQSESGASCALILALVLVIPLHLQAQQLLSPPVCGFLENRGQVVDQYDNPRPDVCFMYGNGAFNLHLRRTGFSFELIRFDNRMPDDEALAAWSIHKADIDVAASAPVFTHRIDVECIGANPFPEIESSGQSESYWNYVIPDGPAEGVTGVRAWSTVIYKNIYPDIDMVFEANVRPRSENVPVKYSFIVHPGGRISNIKLRYSGANALYLNKESIVIETANGIITEAAPETFAIPAGLVFTKGARINQSVPCRYILENNTLRFSAGEYDTTRTLVIDPEIEWCTYYGGGLFDRCYGIDTYPNGDLAVVGRTMSAWQIATAGAFQDSVYYENCMIAKFSSSGTLLWGTYYGRHSTDTGRDIAIDSKGDIVAVGIMNSRGFGTPGVHKQYRPDDEEWEVFIAKFNTDGARLWHTYYGGPGTEWIGFGVALDPGDNIIIAGRTDSQTEIASPGAYQQRTHPGGNEAYVAKFTPYGTLHWATYFGGPQQDYAIDVACDSAWNIYITGETSSPSEIATFGAYQWEYGGANDCFLAKYNSAGTLIWSTYFGGAGDELGDEVAVSGFNVVVTGMTFSNNNIASAGAYQEYKAGQSDAFLALYYNNGYKKWSTYIGGTGDDRGITTLIGGKKIFLAGDTYSESGIATEGAFQPNHARWCDAFYMEFDFAGTKQYGTYFGGEGDDLSYDLAFGDQSTIYLAGEAGSEGLGTPGIHQQQFAGYSDGYILKMRTKYDWTVDANVSHDTTICAGDSLQLYAAAFQGQPPYSYSWLPQAGLDDPSASNPYTAPAITTTYVVTVRDAYGDAYTDSVTVYVVQMPTLYMYGQNRACVHSVKRYETDSIPGIQYLWQTTGGTIVSGQGTNSIDIQWDSAGIGIIQLALQNSAGCMAKPPDFLVDVRSWTGSTPTILTRNDTLVASPGAAYQWYQSGEAIAGATNREFIPAGQNMYMVIVTDSSGCTDSSEYIDFDPCPASAVVAIASIEAKPGDRVWIPISLINSACLDYYDIDSCMFDIYLTGNILAIDMPVDAVEYPSSGGILIAGITGQRSNTDALAALSGTVMLGASDTLSIQIENFRWAGRSIPTATMSGFLRVIVCEEGGKRLFDDRSIFTLGQNHPNPFNNVTIIPYSLIESALTVLKVFDMYGREVATLVNSYQERGSYTVSFDANNLPSGTYYYVLSTPSLRKQKMMRLLK